MAIDYQKVLLDMNRPRRRRGGAWKKVLILFVVLAVLGGGAFGVWRLELHRKAVASASSLAARVSRWAAGGGAAPESSGDAAMADPAVASGPEMVQSMRPPAVSPAGEGQAVDVARHASNLPRALVAPAAPGPEPARQVAAAPAPAAAPAVRGPGAVAEAARPVAADGRIPASLPALSDFRAQIQAIDGMLASDPAEALRRVEDLLLMGGLSPEDAAEAGYRRGYAARLLRNEELAEKSWRETAQAHPETRGGRFAALALGDTWYQRYAGDRPQLSYWDDIQVWYSQVLGYDDAPFLPENVKSAVKAKLTRLNDSLFFGTAPSKMARYHKVESGELLGSIAQKYRVDYESIARINGIDPNRIRVGMDLKLVVGEVNIVVRKNSADPDRQPTLTWFLDGRWIREYPSCVGEGFKTPAGTYNLTSKERDPSWTNPANGQLLPNHHPENILGSRWMAMKGMDSQGLGIHGTTVDDSIPGYTSAGCIRLLNKDVEELFSYARIGNRVTVIE